MLGESEASADVEGQLNSMFKNIAEAAKFLTEELNKEEKAHEDDYKKEMEKLSKYKDIPVTSQLPITPTPSVKPTSAIPHDKEDKQKKETAPLPWYKSIFVTIGNGFASLF